MPTGSHVRKKTDGRRQRSEASRERIVHAMLDLVSAGNVMPNADAVAERAGVGLRTVFRHFDNMESLFQQINALMSAEIMPLVEHPLAPGDWNAQLAQIIDRRIGIFERIMPFKIAADVHRHHSPFLASKATDMVRMQRAMFVAVLPKDKRGDSVFLESLDLLLSFDTWRRLRKDQKLSRRRARVVLEHLVDALLRAR